MGGGAGGMGGGGMGGGGMTGGGTAGKAATKKAAGPGPRAPGNRDIPIQREAARLVATLAILQGGIKLELSTEQARQLTKLLEGVEKEQQLDDAAARKLADAVRELLTSDQRKTLDQISLPAGFEGPPLKTTGGPNMPGLPAGPEDEMAMNFVPTFNPFFTGRNKTWLNEFRDRLHKLAAQ
jgi:hypothetical protein